MAISGVRVNIRSEKETVSLFIDLFNIYLKNKKNSKSRVRKLNERLQGKK